MQPRTRRRGRRRTERPSSCGLVAGFVDRNAQGAVVEPSPRTTTSFVSRSAVTLSTPGAPGLLLDGRRAVAAAHAADGVGDLHARMVPLGVSAVNGGAARPLRRAANPGHDLVADRPGSGRGLARRRARAASPASRPQLAVELDGEGVHRDRARRPCGAHPRPAPQFRSTRRNCRHSRPGRSRSRSGLSQSNGGRSRSSHPAGPAALGEPATPSGAQVSPSSPGSVLNGEMP